MVVFCCAKSNFFTLIVVAVLLAVRDLNWAKKPLGLRCGACAGLVGNSLCPWQLLYLNFLGPTFDCRSRIMVVYLFFSAR